MAKKNESEEKKPWKATTKFFPVKTVARFKLKEGEYLNTERGKICTVSPVFLELTKDGYTPQNEEEENRLIDLAKNPLNFIIEFENMPKSADARKLSADLVVERNERERLANEVEDLKAKMRTAGIPVD